MRNLVVGCLVAVCAVLVSSESALAAFGGGGGKNKTRARVVMKNTGAAGAIGIAAWVRPAGTSLPKTLGELRNQMVFMSAGETRRTGRLKNGAYEITIVDAADTAGPANTPITLADVTPLVIDTENFDIKGVDRTANVNAGGIRFTN